MAVKYFSQTIIQIFHGINLQFQIELQTTDETCLLSGRFPKSHVIKLGGIRIAIGTLKRLLVNCALS